MEFGSSRLDIYNSVVEEMRSNGKDIEITESSRRRIQESEFVTLNFAGKNIAEFWNKAGHAVQEWEDKNK